MSADEGKNAVAVADEEEYIFDKEEDEQVKKDIEQLAEVIKDPQKANRIRKIIELELSGEIAGATRRNLIRGLAANDVNINAIHIITNSIEKTSEFLDGLAKFNISEDVLAFLRDLNLLYNRRARLAYNYDVRKEDWITSNFEIATMKGKDLKITMELIKGNGEIVHIEGGVRSFVVLIAVINDALSDLDLADVFTEEELNGFEKDINALIDSLKRKSSDDSE